VNCSSGPPFRPAAFLRVLTILLSLRSHIKVKKGAACVRRARRATYPSAATPPFACRRREHFVSFPVR
jgi:hypothetical protein